VTRLCRFLDALTNKRRETQDRLGEKAVAEAADAAAAQCRRDETTLTGSDGVVQQNGSAVSAPVTPATTPTAPTPTRLREGTVADTITDCVNN